MGTRGPDRGVKPHPMTKARIDLFLKIYRESGGNFAFAAAAACPGAKEGTDKPCYSSFRQLRARSMGFRAACEEILEQVANDVEAEIHRRGTLGWLSPVFQKGERVQEVNPETGEMEPASIRRYSDTLLIARARSLMPEKFGDKKSVEITQKRAGGLLVIEASDVQHFSQAQIEALGDLMSTIRANREGGTPEIEYQPAPVLEIPVTEIEVETVAVEVALDSKPSVVSTSTEETAEKAFPF